jgi:hypothetical protein
MRIACNITQSKVLTLICNAASKFHGILHDAIGDEVACVATTIHARTLSRSIIVFATLITYLLSVVRALAESTKTFYVTKIALCAVVVLVALPRFDMNDTGIAVATLDEIVRDSSGAAIMASSPDVRQYTSMVQRFRGETPLQTPEAPFAYRVAIPYLASFVPAPVLTALDLVNLAVLVICVLLMDMLLLHQGMARHERLIGMAMFAVSFPVFYYGATGRIDSGGLALTLLICAAHAAGKPLLLWGAIFFAPFAKETTVVAIVLCISMELLERRERAVWKSIFMIAVFAAGSVAIRMLVHSPTSHPWVPSIKDTISNLERPRAYISSILAFGVPGVLAVLYCVRVQFKDWSVFVQASALSVLACAGIWVFSFASAYTDGRFVWIAYPFLIPLALLSLRRIEHHQRAAASA